MFELIWTGTPLDTNVYAFEISQAEGDFATLHITVTNPRVGLLSGQLWATLKYNGTPIFYGRLVGVPDDMQDDLVSLVFLAKPDDYAARKEAVAAPLRVLPYFDPVFVPADQLSDPDMLLESRTQLWHTDRVTHTVSLSDIVAGEDGTVIVGTVFFDSVKVSVGQEPALSISCHAEVNWNQAAKGTVDVTQAIWQKFADANSVNGACLVSYTGGGLMSSWPKTGASIGSGWTVGDSFCERGDGAGGLPPVMLTVPCGSGGLSGNTGVNRWGGFPLHYNLTVNIQVVDNNGSPIPAGAVMFDNFDGKGMQVKTPPATYTSTAPSAGEFSPVWPNYYNLDSQDAGQDSAVAFPLWSIFAGLKVNYEASRSRKETVLFSMAADVQPIVSDTSQAVLAFNLSGAVDAPIDEGAALPIGDVRRNSYMLTDRGRASLVNMLLQARARLIASARCVKVAFDTTFDIGLALTLRKSATIADPRLPGGQATGKVVALSLSMAGADGAAKAQVTIACTIGNAGTLSAPENPNIVLYDDGTYDSGYAVVAASSVVPTEDVSYQPYDDTVPDDDGVDLWNMTPDTCVQNLVVTNGAHEQATTLLAGTWADSNAAIAGLNAACTKIELTLVPLQRTTPFATTFNISVGELIVPKTIDLEAASA